MFIANYFNCDSDSESLSNTMISEDLSSDNDSPDNNSKLTKRSMSYNSFFKNDNLINHVEIVDEYDLLKKINVNTKDNKIKLDKLLNNEKNNKIQFNKLDNKINYIDDKINHIDEKINTCIKSNIKCMIGFGGGLLFSVILLKFLSK